MSTAHIDICFPAMSTLECIVACHPVLTYLCIWQFLAENHTTETLLDAMGMARLVLPSSVGTYVMQPQVQLSNCRATSAVHPWSETGAGGV